MQRITIHPDDNVAVVTDPATHDGIPFGHKVALRDIRAGEPVIKYGMPIGRTTVDVAAGTHVHTHNLRTNLDGGCAYAFGAPYAYAPSTCAATFDGYRRADGRVGIRNDVWILPTVGCVNKTAERVARRATELYGGNVYAFTHPYGCSQMGDDQVHTQRVLAALARHPNAGGVLVLSLGCENNHVAAFEPYLGDYDRRRIRFLVTQDAADEIEDALHIIGELVAHTRNDMRVPIPVHQLVIGFKCGGSDAFSGVTANPLCGRLTDRHTAAGGRAILTEVPEMFGAETRLMDRAVDRDVFDRIVRMIDDFKAYYTSHGQVVYENPSPGNKDGGITTLEEKSLGCIQKGGMAAIVDVLEYAEPCVKPGLSLLTGPGNDMVSCTNLAASGAHIVCFTTGRGTPFGGPVPTVKIATNTPLYRRKPDWFDYDAGIILDGVGFDAATDALHGLLIDIASGRQTQNERHGYTEIAIFKGGVTL